MTLISHRLGLWVFGFSVFVVWGHWNFFSIGVFALGFNFSLFWLGFAVIVYLVDNTYQIKKDWAWLCPVSLIALSYSLYENPWLKLISLFLLPIIIAVFCAYSHFNNHNHLFWNRRFLYAIAKRFVKPLGTSFKILGETVASFSTIGNDAKAGTLIRILIGLAILTPLSLFVILLLSSADAKFSDLVLTHLRFALDMVSWLTLWKVFLSFVLTLALLSIAIAWRESIEYSPTSVTQPIDGLVAGIVLSGLLIIYFAFLALQIDHLLIDQLPANYRKAELMVKSGFWQLFILAVLNTGLFFIVYKKTGIVAQWILRVFILASSLLMLSAAWKVGLYSYTFGLSYEKFFACYTAVFALGVLLYLVVASFSFDRKNAVKAIAFAALWGYSLATVSPVERVIFNTNLFLSQQDNTRISLDQLTQLSLDILPDVAVAYDSTLATDAHSASQWQRWRSRQKLGFCDRAWYELNLSAAAGCR